MSTIAPITMHRLRKHQKDTRRERPDLLPTCAACHLSFPCDTYIALIEIDVQAEVLRLARVWLDAADASEDDGEDEATMDAGHAFTVALKEFEAGR